VDAFQVRMVVMPALHSFLGRSAWWLPHWLDPAAPGLDTEGRRLFSTLGCSFERCGIRLHELAAGETGEDRADV
jgi:RND superfamily putative drug exporter